MTRTHLSTLILFITIASSLHALESNTEQCAATINTPLPLAVLSIQTCMRRLSTGSDEKNTVFSAWYKKNIGKGFILNTSAALTSEEKLRFFPLGARSDYIGGHGLEGVTLAGNGTYVIGHDVCNIYKEHSHIIARLQADGTPEPFISLLHPVLECPPLFTSPHTAEYLTCEPSAPFSRIRKLEDIDIPEATPPAVSPAKDCAHFSLRDKSSGDTWWFRNNGEQLCRHTWCGPSNTKACNSITAYERPYTQDKILCTLPDEEVSLLNIGADGNTCMYVPQRIQLTDNRYYVIQQSTLRVLNITDYVSEKKDAGMLISVDQSGIQNPHIWSIAINKDCTQYACGLDHAMHVFTKAKKPLVFTYRNVPWARWHGPHRDSRALVKNIAFHEDPYIISCTQDCVCIHDKKQPGPAIQYIQTPCDNLSLSFAYDGNYLAIGHVGGYVSLVPFLNDADLTDIQRMLLRIAYDGIMHNAHKNLIEPCLQQLPERIQHLVRIWHRILESMRASVEIQREKRLGARRN